MSKQSHYNRRGVIVSQEIGTDKIIEIRLRRCIHCQFVWQHKPGSGNLRGFCTRCAGDLCGRPACVAKGCVHWERQLEMLESGLPYGMIAEGSLPVSVSVPAFTPAPASEE